MMTRKDFETIAAKMKEAKPDKEAIRWAYIGWKASLWALSDALKECNPRFDKHKFLAACGVEE